MHDGIYRVDKGKHYPSQRWCLNPDFAGKQSLAQVLRGYCKMQSHVRKIEGLRGIRNEARRREERQEQAIEKSCPSDWNERECVCLVHSCCFSPIFQGSADGIQLLTFLCCMFWHVRSQSQSLCTVPLLSPKLVGGTFKEL